MTYKFLPIITTILLTYLNVHIYQDSTSNRNVDYDYISTIAAYIKRTSGKDIVTNETGEKNTTDPNVVVRVLDAWDKVNAPYVLWFSGDGDGGATSFFNPDGSMRSNGQAFKNYVTTAQ